MAKKRLPAGWIILIVLLAIFIILQFFGINRSVPQTDPNKDFMAVANPPQEIQALMHDACYDCHSNETKYPWYSHIQPGGWFMQNHIDEAREHMNFSEWGDNSTDTQMDKLKHSANMVKRKKMPLKSYLFLHPEARLTDEEIGTLSDWFNNYRESLSK
jgi:hypothetical protein